MISFLKWPVLIDTTITKDLYDGAWSTIREITAASSKSHPALVTSFLQGLSEGPATEEGGDHDALVAELSNEALSAYEDDNALDSGKQLLPDLLTRFKGELFKDESFVQVGRHSVGISQVLKLGCSD
jgi:hypothetical protein